MKKFLLFQLCAIAFLATALSSPHNGSSLVSASDSICADANLHNDTCIVVPLQAICAQSLQQKRGSTETVLVKSVNSKLYFRNFYSYVKNKPVIFAKQVLHTPVFRWI